MKPRTRQQILLILALVAALLITGLFAFRLGRRLAHFRQADAPPIAAWMNLHHIARVYGVPPEILYEGLGLVADRADRRPLDVIARQQGQPVDLLIDQVQAAIDAYEAQPPPPPRPPNSSRPAAPESRP